MADKSSPISKKKDKVRKAGPYLVRESQRTKLRALCHCGSGRPYEGSDRDECRRLLYSKTMLSRSSFH